MQFNILNYEFLISIYQFFYQFIKPNNLLGLLIQLNLSNVTIFVTVTVAVLL